MAIKPISPQDLHEQVNIAPFTNTERDRITRVVNDIINEDVEKAMSVYGTDFRLKDVGTTFRYIRIIFGDDWIVTSYQAPSLEDPAVEEEHIILRQKR